MLISAISEAESSRVFQAVRSKEDATWGTSMEEELIFGDRAGMGGGGVFVDDAMFS